MWRSVAFTEKNLETILRLVSLSTNDCSIRFSYPIPYVIGGSLVKLGRAHCKIATLQEAFALTLRDTFMASLQKFSEEIKEYENLRKKLESRRLVPLYDTSETVTHIW